MKRVLIRQGIDKRACLSLHASKISPFQSNTVSCLWD